MPGGSLLLKSLYCVNSPVEALPSEDRQLNLCHIEPTSMLWSMMELDLLAQPECFFCREVLVQGRELVCIEVVADKYDIVGIAVDLVYKPFDLLRPVGLGPRPGYLHVSPAPKGLCEHEGIASAASDVFVVDLLGVIVLRQMYRLSRIGKKLDGLLVHAHDRDATVQWSGIYLKHILHVLDKLGILMWWNAPHLLQMGPEAVFFKILPTSVCDTESTI